MEKLLEYNILDKVIAVTFINVTNIQASIDLMRLHANATCKFDRGFYFPNRCVCHILNLITQVSLKHVSMVKKKSKVLLNLFSTPYKEDN